MERDKRLALELLTGIRDMERLHGVDERNLESNLDRDNFEDADFYHLRLLVDGGFITAEVEGATGICSYRMTWSGHDLLEQLQIEVFKI
jgi:hypothetical protein